MLYEILFLFVAFTIYYIMRYLWELIPVGGDRRKMAVLITGCDSGFGHLLALKCARKGMKVFAGCFTEQGPKKLLDEMAGVQDHRLIPLMMDVSKQESVDDAVRFVKTKLLHDEVLWAVVNNAGILTSVGPHDWLRIEDYQFAIDINLYGVIRVTEAFLPLLKKCKGRVITVSSCSARLPEPGNISYSCSKYAVEAYMDTIRQELRDRGVTCCILEPGRFVTPLGNPTAFRARVEKSWNRLSPELQAEYGPNFVENCYVTRIIYEQVPGT